MKINIILPFSRIYALERVFNMLEALKRPKATSILITCDLSPQDYFAARNVFSKLEGYENVLIMHYQPPNKFNRKIHETETYIRRYRIADIHNNAKQHLLDGTHVFLIEDDGDLTPNTLNRLLKTAKTHPDFGAISGVQVSRHAKPFLGLWQTDNVVQPKNIWSVLPGESEEIDGAGMYALLLPQGLYGKHDFKPYGNILGPDYNLVNSIRKQGHKCYVNWGAKVAHVNKGDVINDRELWRATITRGINSWTWKYIQK